LEELLAAENYEPLWEMLNVSLTTARDPRAVDWVMVQGCKKSHVFAMYLVVRNLLKPVEGRVLAVADLQFGFKTAVLLLLRTYQDVKACITDMGHPAVSSVYTTIRDKVWTWVKQHDGKDGITPSISKIAGEMESWLSMKREHPQPTWCMAFRTALLFGTSFYWGTPANFHISSFRRCTNIPATRSLETPKFMAAFKACSSWEEVFRIPLLE
jgi:hypothetical protein